MTSMASRILYCVVMTSSLSGCAIWPQRKNLLVLPPTEAPLIVMNQLSAAPITTVSRSSAGPVVRFVDHRPDAERHYYPGLLEERQWHDAISMVPMESFDPPIADQIQLQSRRQIEEVGLEVDRIEIELTSFQFVYDQREHLRGDHFLSYQRWQKNRLQEELQEEEETDERRRRRISDELEESYSAHRDDPPEIAGKLKREDNILGDFFGELIWLGAKAVVYDLPKAAVKSVQRRQAKYPLPQQTPDFITNGKQEGLNCRITGTVRLIRASGAEETHPVEAIRHRPGSDESDTQTQIAELVEETIQQFCKSAIE